MSSRSERRARKQAQKSQSTSRRDARKAVSLKDPHLLGQAALAATRGPAGLALFGARTGLRYGRANAGRYAAEAGELRHRAAEAAQEAAAEARELRKDAEKAHRKAERGPVRRFAPLWATALVGGAAVAGATAWLLRDETPKGAGEPDPGAPAHDPKPGAKLVDTGTGAGEPGSGGPAPEQGDGAKGDGTKNDGKDASGTPPTTTAGSPGAGEGRHALHDSASGVTDSTKSALNDDVATTEEGKESGAIPATSAPSAATSKSPAGDPRVDAAPATLTSDEPGTEGGSSGTDQQTDEATEVGGGAHEKADKSEGGNAPIEAAEGENDKKDR